MNQTFKELSDHDVNRIIANLPGELTELMQQHRIVVAGGFCRKIVERGTPKDVDVFMTNFCKVEVQDLVTELVGNNQVARIETSERAITVHGYRFPIQFITHTTYEGSTKILQDFDFTINQAAIYFDAGSWYGICRDRFYDHLASRTLIPASLDQHGGNLMMRMLKFVRQGYAIPRKQLADVMNACFSQASFEQAQMKLNCDGDLSRGLESTLRTSYMFIGKKRFNLENFKEHVQGTLVQDSINTDVIAQRRLKSQALPDFNS